MIGKLKNYVLNLIKFIRHGGVVNVSVSFVQPSERYAGMKVFVSGGSEGLGRAIAEAYLKEGAEVLITGRSEVKLRKTETEINNHKLHTLSWDALDFDNYATNFQEAISIMRKIDIFINNVGGGMSKYEAWHKYTTEVLDHTYQINSKSLFLMCQLQGKYFIANKIKGNILNITSIAGYQRLFDPYAVAKWGATCMTGGIAKTLIPYDIVVNGIAPGTCLTSNSTVPHDRNFEDNAYLSGQPSKRFTMPEEIASLALYLTSGEARQIVGYVIPVDGGACI
jgi:Dehydrogenases with different specificities (related to short-chain alcohol dehydrogenases)